VAAVLEGVSDAVLVARHVAEEGDDAFATLYARYHERLVRACERITRDRASAEDAAQEAFVRVLRHLANFDTERPMWPWLKTIGTRLALDHVRVAGRVHTVEPIPPASLEDGVVRDEERRAVVRALADLPARQRIALSLRYLNDWDAADAATFLGLSRPAFEQLLFRARRAMRQHHDRGTFNRFGAIALVGGLGRRVQAGAIRLSRRTARAANVVASAPASVMAMGTTAALIGVVATGTLAAGDSAASTVRVAPATADAVSAPSAAPASSGTAVAAASEGVSRSSAVEDRPGVAVGGPALDVHARKRGTSEAQTVNAAVWSRMGGQPAFVTAAPVVYCNTNVREAVCHALSADPPVPQ